MQFVGCCSNCPVNIKTQAPRHARKLYQGSSAGIDIDIGIGIGDGAGSMSDSEAAPLAVTQQASLARTRLHHHPRHLLHRQQQQPGQRVARLLDAGYSCPGQRRVMHAIRESPEISNNPTDTR